MAKPKISTEFGQSPKFFGRLDYQENLKRGISSQDMLDFVAANPGLMRGAKKGDVLAEMRAGAEAEAAAKAEKAKAKRDKQTVSQQEIGKGLDQSDYLSQENIEKFQDLLNRLQRSKMQQAEQAGRESRKGTFAQGIASMMSNF